MISAVAGWLTLFSILIRYTDFTAGHLHWEWVFPLDLTIHQKVIVIQGDGGVTIGLQHVLESARRNINMTLVVMNNLLYGMTGGQISGLSTQKFKEQRQFEVDVPPFDIIKLAHLSGAAFSARATSIKTFTDVLTDALRTDGFSIVELSSLCTSYAYKN